MKDKLKSFFLNHGEKLGFGLIVVMALYVLWGTRWSPYSRTPQELIQAAQDADLKIQQATWPESEKQELLPTKDIRDRAHALRSGIESTQYVFSTAVFTPIYPRSEPILPPRFLPPEDMIASADEVLLELPPDLEDSEKEGTGDSDKPEKESPEEDDSKIPEALRKRRIAADGETGALISPSDCGIAFPGSSAFPPGYGNEGSLLSDEYMSGYGGSQSISRNGEGYRFVSIRGVINWAAQKIAYAKALHLPPNQAARAEPTIQDFEIQRQQATSEDDPWNGEWVTLDIKNSVDVLMKAIDFEADVVDVSVTSPVITEPLPRRVLGIWRTHATHPKIENFVLSPEEQLAEQIRQKKLMEAYEALKATLPPDPLQPQGFGPYIADIRGMTNELGASGSSDYMSGYENDYNSEMSDFYSRMGGGAGAAATRPGGIGTRGPRTGPAAPGAPGGLLTSARSAASGRLLLFRYFDFDVEPGAIYRYRVRITYQNPNFGKPIELLASPELAEGQTRTSEWSEPTPPVQVRPESDFFFAGVEYDRAQRANVAALDLYKWNAPTGTVVNDTVRNIVGEEIGGKTKVKVVNPLEETYEAEDIDISTGELLVDLRSQNELVIDGKLEDLDKVPNNVRYDEALVLNSQGNLQTYDRFTRESARVEAQKFQKFQRDLGKEYEEAAKAASDAESLLEGYEGCGGAAMYGSEMMGGRPPSAVSRRSSRSRRPRSSGGGGCGP